MNAKNCLKGLLFVTSIIFAGTSFAEGDLASVGKKIYDRTLQRGCDACHAQGGANPDLFQSVNTLSKEDFVKVLSGDRLAKGMPKVIDQMAKVSGGLSEEQSVDALIAYLKGGRK